MRLDVNRTMERRWQTKIDAGGRISLIFIRVGPKWVFEWPFVFRTAFTSFLRRFALQSQSVVLDVVVLKAD